MEDLERLGYGDWDGPIKVGHCPRTITALPKRKRPKRESRPTLLSAAKKESRCLER